jgi:hypothetical protein
MKDVAFPTPGAQEALLSYLISIARDDKEAVAGVVTDFVRNTDAAEIERALPDPRMAAIATAILSIAGKNTDLIPTPEMLAQWLAVNQITRPFATTDPGRIANLIKEIVVEGRGNDTPSIPNARFILNDVLKVAALRRESLAGAEAAKEAILYGQGSPDERHAQAMELLDRSTPPMASIDVLDGDQLAERYLRSMRFRKAFADLNIPFCTLPPELGLQDYIHRLIPGDMTLITADPKSGKTSLANTIAHWNAKTGKGYIKVLYVHLEDGHDKVADRTMARFGGLNTEALRQGQHIAEVEKTFAQLDWKKHILYMHAPNIRPDHIAKTVRNLALALPEYGSLLVIIDYLNENKLNMRYVDGNNTAEKLAAALQVFKSVTEECSRRANYRGFVHTVVFQQQNKEGTALGSESGYKFAQNVIVLERAKVKDGDTGIDFSDHFNTVLAPGEEPRSFVVRPGDIAPVVLFRIKYTNDGYPGKCAVLFDGERFMFTGPIEPQSRWEDLVPLKAPPRLYR